MGRPGGSDERLDDLSNKVDTGFKRMDSEFHLLRQEINIFRADIGGRVDALQVTMLRVGGGLMVGLVGVIAAVLARG